ncbi:hypothetical protein ACFSO7_12365 [Bacillus sp. CGMCC 1.16607]|uniref:hypothetical protein n=1 Tax=Bacillus sp. CGMCC 1.16607 TaxID=3351842 RepID=UPI00363C27B7
MKKESEMDQLAFQRSVIREEYIEQQSQSKPNSSSIKNIRLRYREMYRGRSLKDETKRFRLKD